MTAAIRKIIARGSYNLLWILRFGLGASSLRARRRTIGTLLEAPPSRSDALARAASWLTSAQNATAGCGISSGYYLVSGWGEPDPEITGYCISTLLQLGKNGVAGAHERALEISQWLLTQQDDSGGIVSSPTRRVLRVFNTGQVLLGWLVAYEETRQEELLQAALNAGKFLLAMQEPDGRWVKNTHCGARTYHSRCAWALLRLYEITHEEAFHEAAVRSLRWVLAQQTENAWFRNCGFFELPPTTHCIGYTLRGLLESSRLVQDRELQATLRESASRTLKKISEFVGNFPEDSLRGLVPNQYLEDWSPLEDNSCLTGVAQLAICMLTHGVLMNAGWEQGTARQMLDSLSKVQISEEKLTRIYGSLAGSYPAHVGYCPHSFPAWGVKFFIDALLLEADQNISIKA